MNVVELQARLTVSVPEAGTLLGVGRDAAYRAAANGEIPVLRIGRTLRVPVPALLALLGAEGPAEGDLTAESRHASHSSVSVIGLTSAAAAPQAGSATGRQS